jgi:hypothetical protein
MVQTVAMGFAVHVVVELRRFPDDALMTALNHHFGSATHELHTKTVELTEHVSVSDEGDAIAFVRGLVDEVIPAGAKVTSISATSD